MASEPAAYHGFHQRVSDGPKSRIGSVKTPKQIEVWSDLPRSKVGKVLKAEVRARPADDQGKTR